MVEVDYIVGEFKIFWLLISKVQELKSNAVEMMNLLTTPTYQIETS